MVINLKNTVLSIASGDTAELKKPHPCGGKLFRIMRAGSDVRIICLKCGRDMTLDRVKFERSVKKITKDGNTENE